MMRDQFLVTTLIGNEHLSGRTYYYSQEPNGKILYCEALTPAEASCKYLLATNKIKKIVILGSDKASKPNEGTGPKGLCDDKSLLALSPEDLSAYSLLRYRLAEYAGEYPTDHSNDDAMFSDKEKGGMVAFLHSFFEEHTKKNSGSRLNRYFHLLVQDRTLQEAFDKALRGRTGEADFAACKAWALHYLYQEMKDTNKMEMLEVNSDITIELLTVKKEESLTFPRHIIKAFENSKHTDFGEGKDILLGIQNSDAPMIYDLINLINMTNVIPDNALRVSRTFAFESLPNAPASEIVDMTDTQRISELLSGIEAFLKYGKTKTIVDYWKEANMDNPIIERIIYAIRNIDNGISLCDITDIERGIKSLREIILEGHSFDLSTPTEQAFHILIEVVRRDYGRLLETDSIEFIDLVRWAYRKEFWQQTLTLIESRAPQDLVEKGFYFYCDSEKDKDKVRKIFGQEYYDLKSYEKYKMNDLDHYYIKFYNRGKASHQKHGKEYIQSYAKLRTDELHSKDDKEIRACTICPDEAAIENLLFAYYYVGDIRNDTNHATSSFDGFSEIMKDSESGERMDTIQQSVDYFLHCYDKVAGLIKDKKANVIHITNDEIMDYVDELREESRRNRRQKNSSSS